VTPIGTLVSLLQQYQASPDFMDLADSTRRSYVALIKRIEKKFSDFPPGHPFLTGVVGVTFNDLRGTAVTPRGAKAVRRPRFSVGGRENYRTMFRLRHFIERRLQGGADWNGQHRGRDRNDYRPQPS